MTRSLAAVLSTKGTFSRDARDAAGARGTVVLVDGDRLAQLMIEHGVAPRQYNAPFATIGRSDDISSFASATTVIAPPLFAIRRIALPSTHDTDVASIDTPRRHPSAPVFFTVLGTPPLAGTDTIASSTAQ